jgi:hypothetical protein
MQLRHIEIGTERYQHGGISSSPYESDSHRFGNPPESSFYDEVARERFGEQAILNFPQKEKTSNESRA